MHLSETTLNEYLDNHLGAERAAAVEQHLAACSACRAQVAELEALFIRLAALADEPLAVDLVGPVLARIRAEDRPWLAPGWLRVALTAQLVASLLLLVGLWPGLQQLAAAVGRQLPEQMVALLPAWFTISGLLLSVELWLAEGWTAVQQWLPQPQPDVQLVAGQGLLLVGLAFLAWLGVNGLLLRQRNMEV